MNLDKNNKNKNYCWEENIGEFKYIQNKNKIDKLNENKFKILFEGYYNF